MRDVAEIPPGSDLKVLGIAAFESQGVNEFVDRIGPRGVAQAFLPSADRGLVESAAPGKGRVR